MKEIRCGTLFAIVLVICPAVAQATDRFFRDLSVESPFKRFTAEAKSPDNADKDRFRSFQASFVYTCKDATANKILWTRAQPMRKPQQFGKDPTSTIQFPDEGSPTRLYISDEGWTVISTGWDELIAVDLMGKDRCRIKLLDEGFTAEENKKYVHNTTAGPMWARLSQWYFLNEGTQHFFVIRPWWGRRVVLSLEAGKLIDETANIADLAQAHERDYVMTELAKGVATRKEWDQDERSNAIWPIQDAAYLAGRLPVPEAAPLLEKLQDTAYSTSVSIGGYGSDERFDGEVNPRHYHTLGVRQVMQLSLRRLGQRPRQFPALTFDVQYEDSEKSHPYAPKPISVPRETNADKVKVGLKAEQVLDLLDGPDFARHDTWEYDMDANPPYTLILTWDARQVTEVKTKTPVAWKDGFTRDE